MMERSGKQVVFMTASSEEEAGKIATVLVEENLAACVSIIPKIRSIYRWEGKVADEEELLLIAKTSEEKFADLCRAVKKLHSYETPEIVAVEVADGLKPYLEWIDQSLGK